MPNEISNPVWRYPTRFISESKEFKRTGTPRGTANELVGVDGAIDGGVRPFPGFYHITDLEYGFGGLNAGGTMRGFFPFLSRVSDALFAYGYLYRIVNAGATLAQWRLKFRIGTGTAWLYDNDFGYPNGLVGNEAYAGEQADMYVDGRFVYVLRAGKAPFAFRIDPPGVDPGYTLVVDTDLGPGPPPEFLVPEKNSTSVATRMDIAGAPHPDMVEALPDITALLPAGDEDATARIVWFGFSDVADVSNDNINFVTNPVLNVRNPSAIGGVNSHNVLGPSELRLPDNSLLWAVPPFPDPTFEDAYIWANNELLTPFYPFPLPRGEMNGYSYAQYLRNVEGEEPLGLNANATYVWAYRLLDGRTGRRSPLSARVSQFPPTNGKASALLNDRYDQTTGQRVTGIGEVTFPMFYLKYKASKYDTLLLYRGKKVTGLKDDQVPLHLETVADLVDYQTDKQPFDPLWKVAAFFSQLSDEELVAQPTYISSDEHLEAMPTGGSGYIYEGVAFLGKLGKIDEEGAEAKRSGMGLVRWSDPFEPSSEMFGVNDRYALLVPAEEVERFVSAGPNLIGLTKQRHYFFRKESLRVKAFPSHVGFGIPNERSACEVGSEAYLVTHKGVKVVDSRGMLSDVAGFNSLVIDEWKGTLPYTEMAYDAEAGVVFMLNTSLREMGCFWFTTSKLTEVHDCPFNHVTEGFAPRDPSAILNDETNPLQRRATFAYDAEINGSTKRWRVCVLDNERRKATYSLMHCTAVLRGATTLLTVGGNTISLGITMTDAHRVENCYLYFLDGANAGLSYRIRFRTSGSSVTVDGTFGNVPAGTRWAISPVHVRVVLHQLGINSSEETGGVPFADPGDPFQQRQANQVGASFVDVSGSAASDTTNNDARFRGLIYKSNAATPLGVAFPVNTDGSKLMSVVEGPSFRYANFGNANDGSGGVSGAMLFPGLETFCSDLDYTLVGVNVTGKIDVSVRERIE